VGCGYVAARCHIPALQMAGGVRLVAVADPDPRRLAIVGPNVRKADNWRALVDADDLDALIVATPSVSHAEIGIAALQAGKHLLLEKPIALTMEESARLCAEARMSDRAACVGLHLRHLRQVGELRGLIQLCGDITGGTSCFNNHLARRNTVSGYERARATGGGVLYDLAYHHFDLYSFLLDSPAVAVECHLDSRITQDDVAFTLVTLANGVKIASSFSSTSYNENYLYVYGTLARVSFDMYRTTHPRLRHVSETNATRLWNELMDGVRSLGMCVNALPSRKIQPFVDQLRAFRERILGNPSSIPSIEIGATALRLVLAAYRSAEERKEIAL
jgi:myo-inositol 2-dehydrogenase / D-chiro-inositol 1-dehydrogenase